MITMTELLSGNMIHDVPIAHQQNLQALMKAMNVIREEYAKPMTVTSGYRSEQQHLRIYRTKSGNPLQKIPMASAHLSGLAVDIADADGALKAWVLQHVPLLEKLGLYCEDFSATKTWCHFQLRSPKSGKRFFMP